MVRCYGYAFCHVIGRILGTRWRHVLPCYTCLSETLDVFYIKIRKSLREIKRNNNTVSDEFHCLGLFCGNVLRIVTFFHAQVSDRLFWGKNCSRYCGTFDILYRYIAWGRIACLNYDNERLSRTLRPVGWVSILAKCVPRWLRGWPGGWMGSRWRHGTFLRDLRE